MRDREWTQILGWPGYRVYRHEINEPAKRLTLWVRRKRGNRRLVCSGCGHRVEQMHEVYERAVRDLSCFEFHTTVLVELYRVRCPDCGIKVERVEQLPSKAPFSKRFEELVGQACESAAARQVARRFGLATSTVLASGNWARPTRPLRPPTMRVPGAKAPEFFAARYASLS